MIISCKRKSNKLAGQQPKIQIKSDKIVKIVNSKKDKSWKDEKSNNFGLKIPDEIRVNNQTE